MQWEYTLHWCVLVGADATASPDLLWAARDEAGKTNLDYLNEFGRDGWELVNSFPVAGQAGITHSVIFVLKRPRAAA